MIVEVRSVDDTADAYEHAPVGRLAGVAARRIELPGPRHVGVVHLHGGFVADVDRQRAPGDRVDDGTGRAGSARRNTRFYGPGRSGQAETKGDQRETFHGAIPPCVNLE